MPGEPTCSSSVSGTQEEAPSASTAAVYSTFDTEKVESHLQLAAKMKAAYLQLQELVKNEKVWRLVHQSLIFMLELQSHRQ